MILKTSRSNLSSNDQLSLDLPFAATKSLTARVGPTPTFTRASSATFVGSNGLIQSAAVNAARFDHDPVTLACKGLLIEEGSENLFIYSTDISSWNAATRVGLNTSGSYLNVTTAPDGTSTADKIVEDASTSQHGLGMSNVVITALSNYTFSFYAKAAERSIISVFDGGYTSLVAAHFNLSSGVSTVNTLSGFSGRMTPAGDGWYRCVVTYPPPSGSIGTQSFARLRINKDGSLGFTVASITYTGDNTSGLYVWGPQFEQKAFPTSYIPTTTARVVRSADVCSITGANFTSFYNQPEGTFFADITPQSIAQLATVLAVNSGSSQNQHGIYKTNAALTAAGLRWGATSVLTGFAIQAAITTGTDVAISRSKLSYAYKLDDFSFAYAGTIVGTDTSGTLPSPTTMQIGNRDGTLQINGHLASIRYYKKRLPNAKLQALTA